MKPSHNFISYLKKTKNQSRWATISLLLLLSGVISNACLPQPLQSITPPVSPTGVTPQMPTQTGIIYPQPEGTSANTKFTPIVTPADLTSTPVLRTQSNTQKDILSGLPSVSPTPDLRMDPQDWQNWPVVPERISESLKKLYREGLAAGNNPHSFSKIGDCQNVSASFMGIYDRPGKYWFTDNYKFLDHGIAQFRGSFDRDGQAVRGGFNVASVLSPLWADRQQCFKGETPLDCEFRLWKPSIAIISMETWFPGRTADTYEKYLRQIIEFTLAQKTVPVLATKADNTEGNHSINLTIARLAHEYDLPLWNFWRAVQPLEGHGLDWERDKDGFHITVEAWDMRSFSALRSLDAVWKLLNEVEERSPVVQDPLAENLSEQLTTTPEATPTQSPTITPEPPPLIITPIPNQVEKTAEETTWQEKINLLFSLGEGTGENLSTSGLFLALIDEGRLVFTRLSAPAYRLEALAPNGKQVLISQDNHLFLASLRGDKTILLSDHFLASTDVSTAWHPATESISAITQTETGSALMLIDPEGSWEKLITTQAQQPVKIFPNFDEKHLIWGEDGNPGKSYSTTLDDTITVELPGISFPVFSPDGIHWTYFLPAPGGKTRLFFDRLEPPNPRLLREIAGYYEDLSWSPDGNSLLAIETFQSGYSNRILQRKTWLFNIEKLSSTLLSVGASPFTHVAWSPDGNMFALLGIENKDNQQSLRLQVIETRRKRILFDEATTLPWGEAFVFLDHVFWAP